VTRRRGQAALLALALLLVPLVLHAQRFAGNDLVGFRTAAARLLAGADLFPGTDGKYAWRYAPGAALLFAPLNLLSLPAARLVWPALEAAALLLVVALLQRRLGPRGWWAAPLAAVALYLDEGARPVLAGAALALAASSQPRYSASAPAGPCVANRHDRHGEEPGRESEEAPPAATDGPSRASTTGVTQSDRGALHARPRGGGPMG